MRQLHSFTHLLRGSLDNSSNSKHDERQFYNLAHLLPRSLEHSPFFRSFPGSSVSWSGPGRTKIKINTPRFLLLSVSWIWSSQVKPLTPSLSIHAQSARVTQFHTPAAHKTLIMLLIRSMKCISFTMSHTCCAKALSMRHFFRRSLDFRFLVRVGAEKTQTPNGVFYFPFPGYGPYIFQKANAFVKLGRTKRDSYTISHTCCAQNL